jgi:hypothetical protein
MIITGHPQVNPEMRDCTAKLAKNAESDQMIGFTGDIRKNIHNPNPSNFSSLANLAVQSSSLTSRPSDKNVAVLISAGSAGKSPAGA